MTIQITIQLNLWRKLRYNLGQNISRLFHVLAQFPLTTGKTQVNVYHHKVSVGVASRVPKRLKT